MNKKLKSFLFLSGCGLALHVSVASADVAQCQLAIDAAKLSTQGTEFLGANPDKSLASLLGKLASAELKVSDGKFADAVAKLMDYQASVIAMADAAKPKIALGDAYGADGLADGIGGLDGNAADAIVACTL